MTPLGHSPVPVGAYPPERTERYPGSRRARHLATVWLDSHPACLASARTLKSDRSQQLFFTFLSCRVCSDNLAQLSTTTSPLADLPEVQAFAAALEDDSSSGNPFLLPSVQSTYQRAVTAALPTAALLVKASARRPDLNLTLEGELQSNSIAREASIAYLGPTPLNKSYASFEVSGTGDDTINVTPQWLPSQTGIGQGLYRIAAAYGVDAASYFNLEDFQAQFEAKLRMEYEHIPQWECGAWQSFTRRNPL
jgi:hypothetical protein